MRLRLVAAAAGFGALVVLGAAALVNQGGSPLAAQSAGATTTPEAMRGTGCDCSGGGSSGMMGGASGMMGGASGMMADQTATPVLPADAAELGMASPTGATVDAAQNRITFTTASVSFTVLASPAAGPDMTFRVAGLTNPTIVVPQDATVTVQVINADADAPHGWLLSGAQPPFSSMAMMDAPPAFGGSFAMPVGRATHATMWSETISFTANSAGSYTYLCPVMGHAQQGMHGGFLVAGS